MSNIFIAILNNALVASWIILTVIALHLILKKIPKWVSCLMWGLVAIKLVIPFSIESIFSLIPNAKPIPADIEYAPVPQIDSGITAVNTIVNPVLKNNFTVVEVASVNPMQVVIGIASYIWIIGLVFLVIYALVSFVLLRSKIKDTKRIDERVYVCRFIESPFILGMINPRIYLPDSMDEDTYACVLEHEKAHIRRGDFIWKPLGFLILAVYWFNPLCWIAYIMLCKDIEYACDEKVTKDKDKAWKATYCQALLNLSLQRKLISACPVAFGEVSVKDRVKSVLNYKKPAFWIVIISVIVCIIVGICFLTNPRERDIRLLEKASPSTSAMSLHYYDGEKTEIKWLYDQKEEQKIIDDINGLATKKVDSERIADFTSPCYGLEISDNDGYMIWLTYCDGLWLNKDGSVYEADFNFERLYNKISVASTQTIIGGAGMTNAGLLGEYDVRYYSKASDTAPEKEGIRIAISSIKGDKITLLIRNNSGEGFIFGKHYSLQKEIDGVWYVLPAKLSNYAFTDIARELPNGESCEEECYLTMYGSLSDGHYRIEKEGMTAEFYVQDNTAYLVTEKDEISLISIIDTNLGGEYAEGLEEFFHDDAYTYYFPMEESQYLECHFSDGSIKTFMEAIDSGMISVSDLDKNSFIYWKVDNDNNWIFHNSATQEEMTFPEGKVKWHQRVTDEQLENAKYIFDQGIDSAFEAPCILLYKDEARDFALYFSFNSYIYDYDEMLIVSNGKKTVVNGVAAWDRTDLREQATAYDLDKDGFEEIIIIAVTGTGTGYSHSSYFVFDSTDGVTYDRVSICGAENIVYDQGSFEYLHNVSGVVDVNGGTITFTHGNDEKYVGHIDSLIKSYPEINKVRWGDIVNAEYISEGRLALTAVPCFYGDEFMGGTFTEPSDTENDICNIIYEIEYSKDGSFKCTDVNFKNMRK